MILNQIISNNQLDTKHYTISKYMPKLDFLHELNFRQIKNMDIIDL